jgi:glycosyltransferase involved in cell wall biosynthesis
MHERYIRGTLEGVLSQTYRPLEFNLTLDASPDNSKDIITSMAHLFDTAGIVFNLVTNPTNLGWGLSFDSARDLATGDFIAMLDGDDQYKPDKIQKSVSFLLQHPEFSMVHTDVDFKHMNGTISPDRWKRMGRNRSIETTHQSLLIENQIYHSTIVSRAPEFSGVPRYKYFENTYHQADYPACLWFVRRYKIGYLDEALTIYNTHPDSLINSPLMRADITRGYAQVICDSREQRL